MINKDSSDYIKHLSEFSFIPGSITAICQLNRAGFDIIIITNQSGIGRKLILPADLSSIHHYLIHQINAAGGRIKDIFFCPHRPEENCRCRKPKAGMIFDAQKKYAIDLKAAIMVGDRVKDMECAQNAGVGRKVLVESGGRRFNLSKWNHPAAVPDQVLPDLFSAAEWIIANG